MSKQKSNLFVLALGLFLLLSLKPIAQAVRMESEGTPQIDVEDYEVEAELFPSNQQIKAKASIRFKTLTEGLASVVLEFNGNLRPQRIYMADNPPAPGAEISAEPSENPSSSGVPRLIRGGGRKAASSKATVLQQKPVDTNLLRSQPDSEDHTIRIDLNTPLNRDQIATVVVEYEGKLDSSGSSPLEGVQVAKIQDEMSYLLSVARWFPINRYGKDRATATFHITVPQGITVTMEGAAAPKEQRDGKDIFTFVDARATFPGSLAAARYNTLPMTSGNAEITFSIKDDKRDFLEAQTESIGKILNLYTEKFGGLPGKALKVAVLDNSSLLGYSAPGMLFLADRAFEKIPNTTLLAREIAYQWWQYLIIPRSPQDLWLTEGFANYSALLYEESISGEEGFAREMRETAVAALLHEDQSTIRNAYQLPMYSPEYNSVLKSKGAFVLHMLRWVLGDENFFKLLKEWVYNFGYKEASIQEFKTLAEKISGENLTYFFSEWIDQNGVPDITFDYTTYRVKEGFKVSGTIRQDIDTFRMPVEIEIETDGKPETKTVEVIGPESAFSVSTFGKPRSAKIDPNFKVLRISEDLKIAVAIARGDELRKLGEPNEAIAEFQKAIELSKRSSLAFYRIGEVFFEQRSYNSSANSFREALNGDLEPTWIEVWCHINLGRIYDVLGQRERALGEYQKAVDTNDDTQGAQEIAQKLIQEPYKYEGSRELIQ